MSRVSNCKDFRCIFRIKNPWIPRILKLYFDKGLYMKKKGIGNKRSLLGLNYIYVLLPLLMLASCGKKSVADHPAEPKNDESKVDAQYLPKENLSPTKLLKISGHIDPDLRLEAYLFLVSTDKSCEVEESRLVGPHQQHMAVSVSVQQMADRYEVVVPVDKFEPGRCGWYPQRVAYSLVDKQLVTVTSGGPSTGVFAIITTKGVTNSYFSQTGLGGLAPYTQSCQRKLSGKVEYILCDEPGQDYSISSETKKLEVNFVYKK